MVDDGNKTLTIKKYSKDLKKEWDDFVKSSKTGIFLFYRDFMEYHSDRYIDYSLMFYLNDALTGIFPANRKGELVESHGGLTFGGLLIMDNVKQHIVNSCFAKLKVFLKNEGIARMTYKPIPHIYHKYPAEEDIYSLFVNNSRLIEVAASTAVNLMNPLKMSKGRKSQINRAKREGVVIKELTDKLSFQNFIEIENIVLSTRHNTKAVHTAEELFMLHERFPKHIRLFGALYDSRLIAGVVIFENDSVIHTQYMAADEKAREIGALDLTVFKIMETYKGNKLWLDFGISTEDKGKILNTGLISQKEGFGGRTNVYTKWEMPI